MEKLKVKKVGKSQFGEWLLLDDGIEKGTFKGSTTQVNGFLSRQVPCEIEVEETKDIDNRKGVITRVKVIGSEKQVQVEAPIEVVKPGLTPASNYKPSVTNYPERISDKERQNSIVTQMCIKGGIELINSYNQISEEKITPTMNNVLNNSLIIREVYDKMLEKLDLPDY